MRLLLAEPDPALSRLIAASSGDIAQSTVCRDFACARQHLVNARPELLVTNLRLADHNGLHLVLLAGAMSHTTRCIVYTDRPDPFLVREAQANGAFFEQAERLPHAITSYLLGPLPKRDRRNAERYDRRTVFRGGRRAADQPVLV